MMCQDGHLRIIGLIMSMLLAFMRVANMISAVVQIVKSVHVEVKLGERRRDRLACSFQRLCKVFGVDNAKTMCDD